MEISCYSCGAKNTFPEDKIMRGDDCEKCMTSLRCCKMCLHYDTSAYNECREPSADRILEKEKANFCDYFQPNLGLEKAQEEKDKVLSAAEALFKK